MRPTPHPSEASQSSLRAHQIDHRRGHLPQLLAAGQGEVSQHPDQQIYSIGETRLS